MRSAAIVLSLLAFALAGFMGSQYLGPSVALPVVSSSLRTEHAILEYVAEKNDTVPLAGIIAWPRVLLQEAALLGWDHCLLLAQAEIESGFRSDRKGKHGEVGMFQILPATAKHFGVLDPFFLQGVVLNTQTATAYLRDIQTRKVGLKDVLAEFNGGPKATRADYYRLVVGAYVEILDRESLRCRFTRRDRLVTLIHEDRPRRTAP
jgi:soluble lytic murein transglycosylase-like protein